MPFDPVAAGKASALAKRRRILERAERIQVVDRVVDELDDVSPAALEAALVGLTRGQAALADVPIDNALDAKRVLEAAEIAHRIARLASGQSTSNNLSVSLSAEERAEHMAYLRSRIGQTDTTPGSTPPTDA